MNYLFKFISQLFSNFKVISKRNYVIIICSIIVFLLSISIFSSNNLFRWAQAGIELRRQKQEIIRYNKEIYKMEQKIDMLSTDKDSLEQFARENFYFCTPGEQVFAIDNGE